jgi:hypothetical protein
MARLWDGLAFDLGASPSVRASVLLGAFVCQSGCENLRFGLGRNTVPCMGNNT